VKYVYVGEMERVKYPKNALAKFEEMESKGLVQVYPTPAMTDDGVETPVVIYEYAAVE
jgi:uncharacterized membrane protein